MKIRYYLTSGFLAFCSILGAQISLDYYLPDDVSYNPDIPVPKQVINHEVGEWHVTHDKLYFYMTELARLSDRAVWEEYGRSYENRPLGQLIISSPSNIRDLEQIRRSHIELSDPDKSSGLDISKMPVFIKLGYGIHGNESSAQNASLLTAYYLVAGEGKKMDDLLDQAVILIDPSLNPDGMQRHSGWVNFTRSLNDNPDPDSWEFAESWPGGRTNHYWFDLNRDYIMLQHPESIGRVEAFYRWRPNINTDHHEMGADATFFFQPGVTSRNNPLVPPMIHKLTAEIGSYHEKFLNEIGSLYYTEEGYDDFYVGKGSSYPDIHGSIGILFEQAGTKGHLRETPAGLLTFPFAIKNHFTVSLSTLEAGLNMREKLLDCQRNFYKEALSEARKYTVKGYVFSEPADNGRSLEFLDILLRHHIKIYRLAKDISIKNSVYNARASYIVPLKQNEYRFIRSLFEPVKEFSDSTFYDISTWVLPMAFNIPFDEITVDKELEACIGSEVSKLPLLEGKVIGSADSYAFLFEWNEYYAPKALYRLQNKGCKLRVSTSEFEFDDSALSKKFSYGTIMLHVQSQSMPANEIYRLLESVARDCGITVYGVRTGLTPRGMDLGSGSFPILNKPSVMMFVGDGISSGDAGEIWHMFDQKFNIPVTLVNISRAGSVNFDRYNVMIIAGLPDTSKVMIERIREWNRKGGTVIAYRSGNTWLQRSKMVNIVYVPQAESKKENGNYDKQSSDRAAGQIPGTIFSTELDLTHPLCYGYNRYTLPVFKTGTSAARKNSNIYNNPVVYSDNPLLSGYCTKDNADRIKGSAFASVHRNRIISIYDNSNFRAFWYGTDKIFMNAVFFGQILK